MEVSAAAFRAVCESSRDAIALVRFEDGQLSLAYANPSMRRLVSESDDAIRAQLASPRLLRLIERCVVEQCSHYGVLMGQASTEADVKASISPAADGLVLIQWVISEAIREGFHLEDAWYAAAEHPADYMNVVGRDGTLLYVNRTVKGFRQEDIIGKATLYDYTMPEDHETVRGAIAAAFEREEVTVWTSYFPIVDNWYRMTAGPVSRGGVVYAAFIQGVEITAQMKAERSLARSESRFRALIENSPDFVTIVDPDLKIIYVNTTALPLTPEQVIGQHVRHFLPSDDVDHVLGLLRTCLTSGAPVEFRNAAHDTAVDARYLTRCRRMPLEGGHGLMLTTTDVTESFNLRAQVEAQREAMLGQLRVKNEELESVVRAASHDLRSPLVNLFGFSGEMRRSLKMLREAAASEPVDAAAIAELIDGDLDASQAFIDRAANTMKQRIDGLLQLSRVGRITHAPCAVDLDAVVRGCAADFDWQLSELGATLEVARLPTVSGHPGELAHVFGNLIGNAIKYRADRPLEIAISSRVTDETGETGTAHAVIVVEDNGVGVAPVSHALVFQCFQRLNPAETVGDGLGLSIARRIVLKFGGDVWLESDGASGSRFCVSLPLWSGAEA